jgi:RNA-directed DNA polymerase
MIKDIAKDLGIFLEYIENLCQKPYSQYRKFSIGKKRRVISAPKVHLKVIQKCILKKLETFYCPPDYVHGFTRGKSFITNAHAHLGALDILSVDLKDFFPSITADMLHAQMREHMNASNALLATNLVIFEKNYHKGLQSVLLSQT